MSRPFVEMNSAAQRQVLAWAQSHDWGARAAWSGGRLRVTGDVVYPGGFIAQERRHFADLASLRAWAGY